MKHEMCSDWLAGLVCCDWRTAWSVLNINITMAFSHTSSSPIQTLGKFSNKMIIQNLIKHSFYWTFQGGKLKFLQCLLVVVTLEIYKIL